MKVSKEIFEKFLSFVGPTSEFPQQTDIFREIKCSPIEICDIHGTFFPDDLYKTPDESDIENFFEGNYNSPSVRMNEYKLNPVLTDKELQDFIEYLKYGYCEIESNADTYIGEISYKSQKLTIFVESYGYESNLMGVFKTYEEGIRVLYSDGEFLG